MAPDDDISFRRPFFLPEPRLGSRPALLTMVGLLALFAFLMLGEPVVKPSRAELSQLCAEEVAPALVVEADPPA